MHIHEYALLLWIHIIMALFQWIHIINGSAYALGSLNSVPQNWTLTLKTESERNCDLAYFVRQSTAHTSKYLDQFSFACNLDNKE